jgi:TfoX N-terminal domain
VTSPVERFAALVDHTAGWDGVAGPTGSRGFGGSALTVGGAIFAMLHDERLVVKLPAARVAAMIADGSGAPFGQGTRRPMREWVAVVSDDDATWRTLAQEAYTFVRR